MKKRKPRQTSLQPGPCELAWGRGLDSLETIDQVVQHLPFDCRLNTATGFCFSAVDACGNTDYKHCRCRLLTCRSCAKLRYWDTKMKSKKMSTHGGQVAASRKTEAAADAEASLDNTGSGNAPVPNEGVEDMKEKEHSAAQNQPCLEPERALIPLDKIEVYEDFYPRDRVNAKAVKAYAAAMGDGAQFPDIDVYRVGESDVLADGRHRIEAARSQGLKSIWARVFSGTRHDAALHGVMSCAARGVRRTHADKRKAVMILLRNPTWSKWNDSEIARRCSVSADLVKTVKAECGIGADDQEPDDVGVQKVRRNGKEYDQKRKAAAKPLPSHIAAIGEMRELAQKARAAVIGDDPGLAERLQHMDSDLHEILGKATGATERMTKGLRVPLNVYERERKGGIEATPEFEKKGLATHALNVGLGCGHQCAYCSSPSLRCRLPAYGELQISPYGSGFAVIDPKSADRISADKPKLTKKDTVMLSTCDDAWSPEARKHGVGRKCLNALLTKTAAKVRILTKSAKVIEDLDVAKDDRERVMVGLSTGIPASREDVAAAVEPNASKIKDRLAALKQAHEQGFKTYAMLCPCLPLVADTESALTEMFKAVLDCGAEDIWLEPVNARGKALGNTAEALRIAGLKAEADAVDGIRRQKAWSKYAADLAESAVKVAETLGVAGKLHVLMYADSLAPADLERVKALGGAVIMLGKDAEKAGSAADDGDAGKDPEKGGDAGEHAA